MQFQLELSLVVPCTSSFMKHITYTLVRCLWLGNPPGTWYYTNLFMLWTSYILKQTWCLFVCVCGQKLGSAWKILPVTARSLWSKHGGVCLSVVTNRAGQGGQGDRCRGPSEVPFLLKKSLGKTEGPASNQTKIQFF